MKAVFFTTTGPPDVLQYGDQPDPVVSGNQVLIRTEAVSVNPIDTYVRSGAITFDSPQPAFPGCDAAGVIQQIGPDVDRFDVGQRVWCTNQGLLGRQGTFAEMIAVNQDWCFPTPDEVSSDQAAANALVGITAHLGLFREARLSAGESILVIGGTGGVGSMVVQMAKAVGATVIATAGSDAKCQRLRDLGADVTINYHQQSIAEETQKAFPDGVNVFWETRREPDFAVAVDVMSQRGRMVLMAGRDATPLFPVGPFYVKECSLHGFAMFKATAVEMRAAATEINQWLASGKLKANIGITMPLCDAAQAHRIQESATLEGAGNLTGKIVLTVNG